MTRRMKDLSGVGILIVTVVGLYCDAIEPQPRLENRDSMKQDRIKFP